MLPVVIVAGLHADARRAAVDRVLATVPGSVALHHDLTDAPAGTVRRTVREHGGVLDAGHTPLVGDCACCALREDLVPELERIARAGAHRLAVVELWDSVEPRSMAEVVAGCGCADVRLTGVVTAVDPALTLPCLGNGDDLAEVGLAAAASDRRTVADTFARQLEYPELLVLADGPEPGDAEDHALLDQLTPGARRVRVEDAAFPAAVTGGRRPFDVEAAAARQHPASALLPHDTQGPERTGGADGDGGVGTLVWRRARPFHPGRLYAALEDLCCAAARSRGRFWLADRPDTLLSWDAAGGALCVEGAGPWLASLPDAAWELVPATRRAAAALDWHPVHGDRGQHLVFTSPDLDRENLTAVLDSCLLTDAEYAAGPVAWRTLPRAFDALLDPVS
ncbi:GTP-binding protein [Streptomyces chumphonensis]|uniref:GTP-binding protein n=1 Tax=Streptomyces chumphonensis TaxID=1214925 RepID=A0A927EZA9_9ACTN|nr:GTP-binding protein [Streptomyces chumphonensis]MBD3932150.1 GTP-binding protein [Streptomyces chumphonensis]